MEREGGYSEGVPRYHLTGSIRSHHRTRAFVVIPISLCLNPRRNSESIPQNPNFTLGMFLTVPLSLGRESMQPSLRRPYGATILGISAVLSSMALLYAGTALASGLGTASSGPESDALLILFAFGFAGVGQLLYQLSITSFVVLTALILAILYLGTGIGFFLKKRWAWTLGVALSLIEIVLNAIQLVVLAVVLVVILGVGNPIDFVGVPGFLIPLLILYYLTRPRVRALFRKISPTILDESDASPDSAQNSRQTLHGK